MAAHDPAPGASAGLERKALYNEDAERGVLGAILLDANKVLDFCIEKRLSPESFYLRPHAVIFAAMQDMAKALRPVDVLTLADRLAKQGQLEAAGGTAFLNQLLDAIPTAAHAEYYIDLVRQQHLLRRIVECARRAESECYTSDQDADHQLARAEQDFFAIAEGDHGPAVSWHDAVNATMETVEHIVVSKTGLSGIPTGFTDLDSMLLGMHNEELIILAARPSMGKTSLALNIMEHVVLGKPGRPPLPVALFSLEMSREQLVMRMLSSHARVATHKIAAGMISPTNHRLLIQAADLLRKAPIYLDDTGGLDIMELRARARRLKKKHGIALIVIDYLQLLHSEERRREGRQQEISDISGSLKNMAKELKVPVLALSQLNRAPEARDREGKPRMADLRDSGSIEQDADVVCLLYRPDKYKDDAETAESSNIAHLIVAKQRNGPTGTINLVFRDDVMRFETMAPALYQADNAPPPGTPA